MARLDLKIFFVTFIVLFSISYSQTNELAATIISVIFILAVIITLLALAGVFKVRAIGGNLVVSLLYGVIILVVFILPLLQRLGYIHIFPDRIDGETLKKWGFPQSNRFPEPVCNVLKMLTLQEEIACYMPELLFLVILPFAAIFAIAYGFLWTLRIFRNVPNEAGINRLLAFIIAFSTIPMGTFMILVAFWFSFMGGFSVAVFVAMFVLGVFFRGYEFVSKEYLKAKEAEIRYLREKIRAALNSLQNIRGFTAPADKQNELRRFLNRIYNQNLISPDEYNGFLNRINSVDPQAKDADNQLENIIKDIERRLEARKP
jgi:hypothetical protein